MSPQPTLFRRQVWANPSPETTSIPHTCSPVLLTSGGLVNLGNGNIITLSNDAVLQPACPSTTVALGFDPLATGVDLSVLNYQDPFYMSTNPQIYAIAAVTIVSYMLVIILFITPRTFYIGGAGGGINVLGRSGAIGGSHGSNTIIGIGSRPWLQKVAAITLAISLTIVTADTFSWAEIQYNAGYDDATELSQNVINGLEIRIVRLISESFLWLAQAQTLIRLFQRHKEKLLIKWIAFILITLEIIFSILNHFIHQGGHQPKLFSTTIPALNYIFSLALNICYAAFVIVYAIRKRRFAFYHRQMHSMPLTALLSLTAVLIPAIFFILDLSKPDVSGWGTYVRWVGACAASVVVWEWVERIEALEREEKKGGILGREIFDGEDLHDSQTPGRKKPKRQPKDQSKGNTASKGMAGTGLLTRMVKASKIRFIPRRGKAANDPVPMKELGSDSSERDLPEDSSAEATNQSRIAMPTHHSGPPPISNTPISRADTASAASTVYMVRQHQIIEPTPPIPEEMSESTMDLSSRANGSPEGGIAPLHPDVRRPSTSMRLSKIPLLFRRQRQSPPAEVAAAIAQQYGPTKAKVPSDGPSIANRLHLSSHQGQYEIPKGIIKVPAPPRRRTQSDTPSQIRQEEHIWHAPESESDDEQDAHSRPPASVRQALRRRTPVSPSTEGHTSPELRSSPHPAAPSTVAPSIVAPPP